MTPRLIGALIAIVMTAAGAVSAQAPATPPAPAGDAAAGKGAFIDYGCYYCHGTVGQGSLPNVGPRIARVPRSFDSFRNYVRRPAGRMSSYSAGVLSDGTLQDIYAYLRSLPEPSGLPAILEQLRKR